MARRGRQWLYGAVIAVVLLAGQELLFRALFPMPEVAGFNRIHYQMLAGAHPRLHQTLRRGLVYDQILIQSQPDGFSEVHKLNLYGFRGPDFNIDPPRDRRRIVVIGDSVTEGQGRDLFRPRLPAICLDCWPPAAHRLRSSIWG